MTSPAAAPPPAEPSPTSPSYYIARAVTPDHRRAVRARFALLDAWLDLDTIGDPQVASVKRAWWCEEIGRWLGGEPRHPATQSLEHAPDAEVRVDALAAVEVLAGDPSATPFAPAAPAVWRFVLRPFIVPAADTADVLGGAHGHCRRIVDYGWWRRHGPVAGTSAASARELGEEIDRALTALDRAQALLTSADSKAARVMIALDRALMTELVDDPAQVIDHRVSLTPLRMMWLSWRA